MLSVHLVCENLLWSSWASGLKVDWPLSPSVTAECLQLIQFEKTDKARFLPAPIAETDLINVKDFT